MDIIRQIEREQMKPQVPAFGVGDTVDVHYRIREGEKERIQVFTGTVLAVKGSGIRQSVIVRRIVAGEGVERTFPLHSPLVAEITVQRKGRVRRAKLYYLRERVGKAGRVRQTFSDRGPGTSRARTSEAGAASGGRRKAAAASGAAQEKKEGSPAGAVAAGPADQV